MTFLRLLLLACALSAVTALAACGDDDYSVDAAPTPQVDLSATATDGGLPD